MVLTNYYVLSGFRTDKVVNGQTTQTILPSDGNMYLVVSEKTTHSDILCSTRVKKESTNLKKTKKPDRDSSNPVLPPTKAPLDSKDESSGKGKKKFIDLIESDNE
jgi:hypothetical protein